MSVSRLFGVFRLAAQSFFCFVLAPLPVAVGARLVALPHDEKKKKSDDEPEHQCLPIMKYIAPSVITK